MYYIAQCYLATLMLIIPGVLVGLAVFEVGRGWGVNHSSNTI